VTPKPYQIDSQSDNDKSTKININPIPDQYKKQEIKRLVDSNRSLDKKGILFKGQLYRNIENE